MIWVPNPTRPISKIQQNLKLLLINIEQGEIYIYIYIYIYKQRSHVEKYEVIPSDAFYAKRIEIFSNATSEIMRN